MSHVVRVFLLGGLAVAALPAPAAAQFYPVIGPNNPLYNPSLGTPYPRLWQPPAWRLAQVRSPFDFQFSLGISLPMARFPGDRNYSFSPVGPRFPGSVFGPATGNPSAGGSYFNGSFFAGMTSPSTRAPQGFYPYLPGSAAPPWGESVSSGYISGGGIRNNAFVTAQRAFEQAQREAGAAALRKTPEAAKNVIYDQWAYERLGVFGGAAAVKGGEDQPAELAKALAIDDEESVASGDALNHILVAIAAAEAKGGKGPSAFLNPQILDAVRFSGPPAADAANLVRQAGKLPFPAAFDDPKLRELRNQLEEEFAAAVAPLKDGKPADPGKLARVGLTLRNAQESAGAVIRNLPFEEATAARRFLNRFEKALEPLRGPSAPALVHPAWVTDGTGVADLVKYMGKYKLLFGPAPAGRADSYLALHRALATYLFAVSQPPPKK